MIPFRRPMPPPNSARTSRADLVAYERSRSRKVTAIARAPRGPRFTEPAAGIAIVPEDYATNMDAFVTMLTPRETPADRMMLINGEKPTFVSRGRGEILNKRQQRAALEENNRRALGLSLPPKKSEMRKRMETEGCILFTDGYVQNHKDSQIASLTSPFQECYTLEPPSPSPKLSLKKYRQQCLNYLISQAELEHRPLFRRIDSSVIYGEPCAYEENTGNALAVPAVSTAPASPSITHPVFCADCSRMNPTWSAFSLDQGVSSSSSSSRMPSLKHAPAEPEPITA